jgi:propanediol dehydratase small subunit
MSHDNEARLAFESLVRRSLNGGKTRPLTAHAKGVLRSLTHRDIPTREINPGVVDRLTRESLAELVLAPSPYKTHGGADCWHLRITDAGRGVAA